MRFYGDCIPDISEIYPEGYRTLDETCPEGYYEDENGFWCLPEIEEDLPF